MKILVLFWQSTFNDRQTIDDHLYSFKRYSNANCFYINTYLSIPFFLKNIDFDLVVYHYTFLGHKYAGEAHFKFFLEKAAVLKDLKGYKVALPQDEYVHTEVFCKFLKDFKIDKVYTCFYENDWDKIYPKTNTGVKELETVLTGYVDEISLGNCQLKYRPHSERLWDIGYRARKVPFWLGEHGTIKWRLTELFDSLRSLYPDLKMNISNEEKDVFKGNTWIEFLLECRVVLGCEGGASLHDPTGDIRTKVDEYVKENSVASFEEVRKACFPKLDFGIELFAISPRHFDACMTKTCQVLVSGKYHDIFKPGVHYIELKKDFSNLDEVIKKIQDVKYCEKIAENAYKDIIESGKYTYAGFVSKVLADVPTKQVRFRPLNSFIYISLRIYYELSSRSGQIFHFVTFYVVKNPLKLLFKYTGLLPLIRSIIHYINRKFLRGR